MPGAAVETGLVVAAPPRRQQAEARQLPERQRRRTQAELRRPLDRRRLVAVEAVVLAVAADAAAVAARSRARRTRMAPSTRRSSKWRATPTACRRCSSGRRT